MPDGPYIRLNADGTYADANAAALDLLGVSLDEFLASAPSRFAVEPADPDADAAFRDAWESSGRPDLGGSATIRRADGRKVRVKFAIQEQSDGTFHAFLTPVAESIGERAVVFTAGEVLAAWRAAERRLERVAAGSPEWATIQADIAEFRARYQTIFQRQQAG